MMISFHNRIIGDHQCDVKIARYIIISHSHVLAAETRLAVYDRQSLSDRRARGTQREIVGGFYEDYARSSPH